MLKNVKKIKRPLFGIEDIFVFLLIGLSIIEFFGMLPNDMGFIQKIVSWTAIGFLVYDASITKLFFGERHKLVDLTLIFSFFLIVIKDLVAVSSLAMQTQQSGVFSELHALILNNLWQIEQFGFILGTIIIILSSIYLAKILNPKKPSIFHIIHWEYNPKNIAQYFGRFLLIFITINAFFILIINLAMEWLAMVIDSSIVVFGIIFFIIMYMTKKSRDIDIKTTLLTIGDAAEDFFDSFIAMFNSKQLLFLGLSGILVFHLLTDAGVFILPSIFPFQNSIYFGNSALTSIEGTESLLSIYLKQIDTKQVIDIISISFVYIANIIAILSLLLSPAYIWSRLFLKKKITLNPLIIAIFFSAVYVFVSVPLFGFENINSQGIVGVSISAKQIPLELNTIITMIISILAGIIALTLCKIKMLKEMVIFGALSTVLLFFSFYIYYYFISTVNYYLTSIAMLWQNNYYYLAAYFSVFLAIIASAYAIGAVIFLYQSIKEYKIMKI